MHLETATDKATYEVPDGAFYPAPALDRICRKCDEVLDDAEAVVCDKCVNAALALAREYDEANALYDTEQYVVPGYANHPDDVPAPGGSRVLVGDECVSLPNEAGETVLEEAQRITGNGGDRNDAYDHPMPNFSKIAVGWAVIAGVEITPAQTARMMIWLKVVRDNHKPQRDNLTDIAGYARCIERLDEVDNPLELVRRSS